MSCDKDYEESLNRLKNLPKQELDEELKKQWELFKERLSDNNAK